MKYIVSRTSIWTDEKPIEEAVEGEVHEYNTYCDESILSKNVFKDIIKLSDGHFRGTYKQPVKVWVVEVDDLIKFVDKYGPIIIQPADNEEGLYEIEIYDYYRE